MKAVLWGIALATVCLLQTAAEIPVQTDFDPKKFIGKWLDNAIILDAPASLKTENGHHITVVATKKGNLIFHVQSPEKNCKREKVFLHMTAKPGIYEVGLNTLYMLKTGLRSYAAILVVTPGGRVLHLYGRESQATEGIKEEFRKLALSMFFPVDNIIYFKKAGPCPKLTFPEVS